MVQILLTQTWFQYILPGMSILQVYRMRLIFAENFARTHDISLHTFINRLYKFRHDHDNKSPEGFVRPKQMPVGEIILRYPNGVELLVPNSTPASVLIDLIKLAN